MDVGRSRSALWAPWPAPLSVRDPGHPPADEARPSPARAQARLDARQARALGRPAPARLEAPARDERIAQLVRQVDPARLQQTVQTLAAMGPRDIAGLDRAAGSGNARATEWLRTSLAGLGYQVSTPTYQQRRFGPEANVVAEKRGTKFPNEVVVVVAHFDDVGHPHAGADDNASGTSALLEMARLMAAVETERTIRFVAVNGEESGLRGSTAYVKSQADAGTLSQHKMALVLDMIGYNENNIIDVETGEAFRQQAELMAQQARAYTSLTPRVMLRPWGSDHIPFIERGVPAVLSCEYWPTHSPCWHGACDKPEAIRFAYAADVTRMNLATLAVQAGLVPARAVA